MPECTCNGPGYCPVRRRTMSPYKYRTCRAGKYDLQQELVKGNKLPGLTQIGRSFASSMVAWAKAGFTVVSREVFNRRRETCEGCDRWDARNKRCTECGCRQVKLWLATEQCPLERWHAET